MRWSLKLYVSRIYLGLRLKLVGWPDDIPFTNLSRVTCWEPITRLVGLWDSRVLRFEPVSDDEAGAARRDPMSATPAVLHDGIPARLARSDVKKRRYRPKTNPLRLPYRHPLDGPKSARWVSEDAERRAEEEMPVEMESAETVESDRVASFYESQHLCFWCARRSSLCGGCSGPSVA